MLTTTAPISAAEPQQDLILPGLQAMKKHFQSGQSSSYEARRDKLLRLQSVVRRFEEDIFRALYDDLHKGKEEAWATEIGIVHAEIRQALSQLTSWMRPKRVGTNLANLPSSSHIYNEPLGVVLVIAPWNYPFMLLLSPLIGAIAAGNAAVLKPSEYAPATDALIKKMISETFAPEEIMVVQGDGATVLPAMMNHFRFDHVFFTGGTTVGRIIYQMAASQLVPVTLELGGKSPCVVEADANIEVAARRIALAKFSNAGQMCIAPDYILVHHSVKDKLVDALKDHIRKFYSGDPAKSEDFGRIINEKQFRRLVAYLQQGRILEGGKTDESARYIAPSILDEVSPDAPIMKEEIFGPILPVLTYKSMEEALQVIARNPNPLAFYIFTNSEKREKAWIESVPFGGGCVNNTAWHFTNPSLPFGGRGYSGTGACHGKFSYDCFSHRKSVMKTPTWFDPGIKYPPFKGKLSLFKKLIR
ncbi:aldehyde dehydrogenase family protein [Flavihumibacter stibioxidans]|nr:aldehyde dehydrogenase family protein [Flavihumibacter stibioxidans]